jgi:L-threonylcarbamoyladenylate synthase
VTSPALPVRLASGADARQEAADLLRAGQLVALPTETVYGLAARADDERAVQRIFLAKGRPSNNPLIVHCAEAEEALFLLSDPQAFVALAARFWPGPLTLIGRARETINIASSARAGLPTIAVRVPAHEGTRDVIRRLGQPIVMPSANRSGRLSPVEAGHVLRDHDATHVALLLDDGAALLGLESTVIGLIDEAWTLLRHGALAPSTVEIITGPLMNSTRPEGETALSPGQQHRHYAPRHARVHWLGNAPASAAILGFCGTHGAILDLSPTGNLGEAARHLYRYLDLLDGAGFAEIAVAPLPSYGIGAALNDRLARAVNG